MGTEDSILLKYKLIADKTGLTSGLSSAVGELKAFGAQGAGAAGILAAGIGAAAMAIKAGISAAIDWNMQVRELQHTTGMAAEDASKFNFVLEYTGSSADKSTKALVYFNNQVMSGGKGFKEYGIATQDANGKARPFMDLLGEVAARVENASTGQEKLNIATMFFGRRAGLTMLPILELGKEKIKELNDECDNLGLTMSQKNVDAAVAFTRETKYLGLAWEALKTKIGNAALPVLTEHLRAMSQAVTKGNKDIISLREAFDPLSLAVNAYKLATSTTTHAIKEQMSAEERAALAEKQRIGAIDDLNNAIKKLRTIEDDEADINMKYQRAQLGAADAAANLTNKVAALAQMQTEGGHSAEEIAAAQRDVQKAQLDVQQSGMDLYQATQAQIVANGQGSAANDALKATLAGLQAQGFLTADQVAKLTAQINTIPLDKTVTIHHNIPNVLSVMRDFNSEMATMFPGGDKYLNLIVTKSGSGSAKPFQYGGWVRRPTFAVIGEKEKEFVLSGPMLRGQQVIPQEVKEAVGGGRNGGAGLTIQVNNPTFLTGSAGQAREFWRFIKRYADEEGLR